MRVEALSVVLPEAANQMMAGNTQMMQIASKIPLWLSVDPLSIKGTWKRRSRRMAQVQNAPRTFFIGLYMRDMNRPIVKGQSIRNVPPRRLVVSIVQPTPMDP